MGLLNKKKEYDYFGGFARCAQAASEAARYLCDSFEDFGPRDVASHVDAMHRIENDADIRKHEMTRNLARAFITPIEREDIAALSQNLDDIIDAVEDVMRRIYMFGVKALRPEALDFARLIVLCCDAFEQVVAELPNFKKSETIGEAIIEVNTLESRGDKLHAEAMHRLFTQPADAQERLVWMNLFEALEACLDACEHAADIIEGIVMKNT